MNYALRLKRLPTLLVLLASMERKARSMLGKAGFLLILSALLAVVVVAGCVGQAPKIASTQQDAEQMAIQALREKGIGGEDVYVMKTITTGDSWVVYTGSSHVVFDVSTTLKYTEKRVIGKINVKQGGNVTEIVTGYEAIKQDPIAQQLVAGLSQSELDIIALEQVASVTNRSDLKILNSGQSSINPSWRVFYVGKEQTARYEIPGEIGTMTVRVVLGRVYLSKYGEVLQILTDRESSSFKNDVNIQTLEGS